MNGYYVFHAPAGYKYERVAGQGKMLVPDEPKASVIREVLEGFASGRFASQIEIKRHLDNFPEFTAKCSEKVHLQRVKEILMRPVYAGYMDAPKWGIGLTKGRHEPLISFETYERVQERLNGPTIGAVRKDTSEDFPLRGIVCCASCANPMTAAWSRGRTARYAYYFCHTKACEQFRKSVRKEKIEGEFDELLDTLRPSEAIMTTLRGLVDQAWETRIKGQADGLAALKADRALIERKLGQIMERLVDADSPALISAYEDQIRKLQAQKVSLEEKLVRAETPEVHVNTGYRTALSFVANPGNYGFPNTWWSADSSPNSCLVTGCSTAEMRVIEPPESLTPSGF